MNLVATKLKVQVHVIIYQAKEPRMNWYFIEMWMMIKTIGNVDSYFICIQDISFFSMDYLIEVSCFNIFILEHRYFEWLETCESFRCKHMVKHAWSRSLSYVEWLQACKWDGACWKKLVLSKKKSGSTLESNPSQADDMFMSSETSSVLKFSWSMSL